MLDGAPPTYDSAIAVPNAQSRARAGSRAPAPGFDFLKIYNRLSREAFLALADEARMAGVSIAGEVPDSMSPQEAAQAGMRSFEHLWNLFEACVPGAYAERDALHRLERRDATSDQKREVQARRDRLWINAYDEQCANDLVAHLARSGTWQVPTLVVNRSYAFFDDEWPTDDPRRRWVPKKFTEHWAELRAGTLAAYGPESANAWHARYAAEADLVRRMSEAGVGILAGSDAIDWEPYIYAGASLHDELELLVKAGLTPLQSLRAATMSAAMFMRREDLGTVEEGKLADLVVLDADPLLDIGNIRLIHAVIFDGRLHSRAELDALIARAIELARD